MVLCIFEVEMSPAIIYRSNNEWACIEATAYVVRFYNCISLFVMKFVFIVGLYQEIYVQ